MMRIDFTQNISVQLIMTHGATHESDGRSHSKRIHGLLSHRGDYRQRAKMQPPAMMKAAAAIIQVSLFCR